MINNLTGTKGLFNDEINVSDGNSFAINFISNNTNYIYILTGGTGGGYLRYRTDTPSVVTVYDSGQEPPFVAGGTNNAYKTIEITDGTDVTNATLISGLEANATQIITGPLKTSFSKISYDAVNKILTIDDKYYQLSSTATGSNITGTSFSNMSLDELGELIIDNTSIHLPIKTTQISFNNGGTYTCANGVTFTMSAFGYLDDHGYTDYQGYGFANSLGRDMCIGVIEDDNQPYVGDTSNNGLGADENEAQGGHTTYTSYADNMYVHIVNTGLDYNDVASELGGTTGDDWVNRGQEVEAKFEGIDYVFLHFKRNRTTGYGEIQEES